MYLVFTISILKGLYYLMLMFQQEHYVIKRMFRYFKKYYFGLPFTVITYLSVLFLLKNTYVDLLVYIFVFIFSLIKNKYIIKLKFTKRLIRLCIICLLLSIIPFIFSFSRVTFLLVLYLLPFIVMFSALFLYPLESLIIKSYKNKCSNKLKKINPFIVCITGSYGKTSVKKILENIYKKHYLVSATPKSYNTPMGITKYVLNDLSGFCDLFFVEAGATKRGDIEEIAKMVKPSVGVITSIGYQHMDSFKHIDNVLKTKWELAINLDSNSKLVLNYGNEYLNGLCIDNIKDCIGVNKYGGMYYACNIKYNDLITEFDIYSYNKLVIHVKTKLLGEHNIDNIVLCYGIKKMLDDKFYISDDEFIKAIYEVSNAVNRLSVKDEYFNNVHFRYLDDSFNSNVEGFNSACKVLKRTNGIKCMITPGVVDGGGYASFIAEKIIYSLDGIDDLILVNNKELKYLKSLLNKKNINYVLVDSYNAGINYLKSKYYSFNGECINILIENDLPDNYLMR